MCVCVKAYSYLQRVWGNEVNCCRHFCHYYFVRRSLLVVHIGASIDGTACYTNLLPILELSQVARLTAWPLITRCIKVLSPKQIFIVVSFRWKRVVFNYREPYGRNHHVSCMCTQSWTGRACKGPESCKPIAANALCSSKIEIPGRKESNRCWMFMFWTVQLKIWQMKYFKEFLEALGRITIYSHLQAVQILRIFLLFGKFLLTYFRTRQNKSHLLQLLTNENCGRSVLVKFYGLYISYLLNNCGHTICRWHLRF